jgi:hypothetical protein
MPDWSRSGPSTRDVDAWAAKQSDKPARPEAILPFRQSGRTPSSLPPTHISIPDADAECAGAAGAREHLPRSVDCCSDVCAARSDGAAAVAIVVDGARLLPDCLPAPGRRPRASVLEYPQARGVLFPGDSAPHGSARYSIALAMTVLPRKCYSSGRDQNKTARDAQTGPN